MQHEPESKLILIFNWALHHCVLATKLSAWHWTVCSIAGLMHCSIWRFCVSLLILWCLRNVSIRICKYQDLYFFCGCKAVVWTVQSPKSYGVTPSNVVLNYFCGGNEDCSCIYMRLQDSDLKVFSRNFNPECSGLWQVDSSWQVDSWMCQYKWRIRMFRFSWMSNQELFCFCNALMNRVAMWLKCCQECVHFLWKQAVMWAMHASGKDFKSEFW